MYHEIRDTLNATLNTQYAILNAQYETKSTKDYVRNYQLFMQNKPKVKYAQFSVSSFITNKYVKMDTW